MKKTYSILWKLIAIVAVLPLFFSSCSSDDPDYPVYQPVKGVYVFCAGNQTKTLPGELDVLNVQNNQMTTGAFKAANGDANLGITVQNGVFLGDKLYVAVSKSNLVMVADRNSLNEITKINFTNEQGTPRFILTDGKYLYVSLYTGQVARINPTTNTVDKVVAVGPNPEQMVIANGFLYVVNSDGMNWQNGYKNGFSVSKISLEDFAVIKTIKVGMNPTKITADYAGRVYVICIGNYGNVPSTLWEIGYDDKVVDTKIPATQLCAANFSLFLINAPFGKPDPTLSIYSTITGELTALATFNSADTPQYPQNIIVNPIGNIYIPSFATVMKDGKPTAGYLEPGLLFEYNALGQFVNKYSVGLQPQFLLFNY